MEEEEANPFTKIKTEKIVALGFFSVRFSFLWGFFRFIWNFKKCKLIEVNCCKSKTKGFNEFSENFIFLGGSI